MENEIMNPTNYDLYSNQAIKNRMKLLNDSVRREDDPALNSLRMDIFNGLENYLCNTPDYNADIGQIIRAIDKIDNALYTINKAERLKSYKS